MTWLGPYSARSCPVKTFNASDPTLTAPPQEEADPAAFQASRDFREQTLTELAACVGAVDLRGEDVEATRAAVAAGAALIVRPMLPRDKEHRRIGSTDALVRDPASPVPRYWPVKIKPYRVTEKQSGGSGLLVAPVSSPLAREVFANRRYRTYREGALLELAHVWRMLEASGWAAEQPLVGIIDDDQSAGGQVVWVDLSARFLRAFSRAQGYKLHSPLSRYDHEYRFRLHVLASAEARTGVDDPPPVVRPIRIKECEYCEWWEVCRQRMDDDDLSIRLTKTPFDVRELEALSTLGIHTVAELAAADVEALVPGFLALTQHRDRGEARLRQAHRRSQMLARGVALERTSAGPIEVPRAGVEIDFDIETSVEGRVYLWGCLVSGLGEAPRYVSFANFSRMSGEEEAELAARFAQWLIDFIAEYPETLVYHYSDYELVNLRRIAARQPVVAAATALAKEHFVDLYQVVRANFIGVEGLGLKVVATRGADFAWRDDDPGGLQSQTWFADAVDSPDPQEREAARIRVLEYNEDDVRATYEVRNWLTELDASADSAQQ